MLLPFLPVALSNDVSWVFIPLFLVNSARSPAPCSTIDGLPGKVTVFPPWLPVTVSISATRVVYRTDRRLSCLESAATTSAYLPSALRANTAP